MRVSLRVNRPASLTLTVRNPRTGHNLALEAGTKVAATVLKQPATAVRTSLSRPQAFLVVVALAQRELVRGREYQLVLDAVATSGKRSRTKVDFRA